MFIVATSLAVKVNNVYICAYVLCYKIYFQHPNPVISCAVKFEPKKLFIFMWMCSILNEEF